MRTVEEEHGYVVVEEESDLLGHAQAVLVSEGVVGRVGALLEHDGALGRTQRSTHFLRVQVLLHAVVVGREHTRGLQEIERERQTRERLINLS